MSYITGLMAIKKITITWVWGHVAVEPYCEIICFLQNIYNRYPLYINISWITIEQILSALEWLWFCTGLSWSVHRLTCKQGPDSILKGGLITRSSVSAMRFPILARSHPYIESVPIRPHNPIKSITVKLHEGRGISNHQTTRLFVQQLILANN